jgi:hypothetical protein
MKILFLLIVLSLPSLCRAETGRELLVPIAGRIPRPAGGEYVTDLMMTNAADRQARVSITFRTENGQAHRREALLGPRHSLRERDVLSGLFGLTTGLGFLEIRSSAPLAVTSRNYVNAPERTVGAAVAAISPRQALRKGELALVHGIPSADRGEGFNLLAVETRGHPLELRLEALSVDGRRLASGSLLLRPHQLHLAPLSVHLGGGLPLDAVLKVTAFSGTGRAIVYGFLIEDHETTALAMVPLKRAPVTMRPIEAMTWIGAALALLAAVGWRILERRRAGN